MFRNRPITLAAIWLALPIVGAIVAATLEPIPPHDYWWHLVMGRLIAAGQLPDANLFLYTLPADMPFVDQPWLGQWLMWLAYDVGGYAGTILLRNALLAASFLILLRAAYERCRDARAVGALGLLSALLVYPVLTVRTRMFAFLPFAVVLWACIGVADGRLRRRWLAVVPLVTVFWANTHGSFVLSAAIVLAVGLGDLCTFLIQEHRLNRRAARDWGLLLLSVLGAGAVSPLGFGVYGYVAQLTLGSTVARTVTEWLPPDVGEFGGQVFLAAVVASLALLFVRRRNVALGDVFLFAGTLFLAAGAVRSVYWWAAPLPVLLAPHLSALLPAAATSAPSRLEQRALAVALGLMVVATIAVQPGIARDTIGAWAGSGQARRTGPGAWVLNHENAEAAIARLDRDKRQRVFHDQVLGGMLEFMLTDSTPAQVAYVDQRMEFVPERVWSEYFALSRAAPNWGRELERLGVDTLLLAPDSQWPLVQAALASPDWVLAASDQSHLLLYRAESLDRTQDPPE